MGIHDREYYRDSTRGSGWLSGAAPGCKILIVINVVVFLITVLDSSRRFQDWMVLSSESLFQYGQVWRLLTAAFMHADGWHIAMNMLFLWIVGRDMEALYGRREFLAMYITAAIVGNLTWAIVNSTVGSGTGAELGASGAVWAVVMLYTLYYPNREILLFGILPMPMWLLATLYLGFDLISLLQQTQGGRTASIAFAAHLGGAAYGALYKVFDLRWSRLAALAGPRRPTFRVVRPEVLPTEVDYTLSSTSSKSVTASPASRPSPTVLQAQTEEHLEARVDEILAKIAQNGPGSLTDEEQRILQEASRRAKAKRGERL